MAQDGRLVTFGVVPDHPETGYGYIKKGAVLTGSTGDVVEAFVEKPDTEVAQGYLESGDYLWNSGIFLLRADRWLEELERFRPDILEACKAALAQGREDQDFSRPEKSTVPVMSF